jgi:TonB family protein
MQNRIGWTRPITLKFAERLVEPGIVGIWQPVLLWPKALGTSLTDEEVESIIAHEVSHVERHDNLFASLHTVATTLFWFHPLIWWIGARLMSERERACDERVLALGQQPAAYAASILKTCEFCIASPHANVSCATGGDLNRRITRIMKHKPSIPLSPVKRIAFVVAALAMFIAPIGAGISSSRLTAERANVEQGNDIEVHRPGGNVTSPRLLREVKPHYSERAKQEQVQGEVLMECVVKADGTVGEIKVVKKLHPDLDQAAMDAASQWLFEPGKRDGKPVNVLVTIAMTFTLKD